MDISYLDVAVQGLCMLDPKDNLARKIVCVCVQCCHRHDSSDERQQALDVLDDVSERWNVRHCGI